MTTVICPPTTHDLELGTVPITPSSVHSTLHVHTDPPHHHPLSQHAITSLLTSLFQSQIDHHNNHPQEDHYTLTMSYEQIRYYHILMYHHITCHEMDMDDETHELLSYGSTEQQERHHTWGEMHEKRLNWLEHHMDPTATPTKTSSITKTTEIEHSAIATKSTISTESKPEKTITTTTTTTITPPPPQPLHPFHIKHYVKKYLGQHQPTPPMISWWDQWWAFLGSFLGILIPAFLHFKVLGWSNHSDLALIIGSFGASAVLLYSAIGSDLAQPRNVLGGHMVSALMGVIVQKIIPSEALFVACGLAVALAIVGMNITKTVHPPGGATALIAVLPSKAIQDLGFLYIVMPVGTGIALMIFIALICNNMPRRRTWPRYWI